MPEQTLSIGELANRTGIAPSALRYYEELGLIPPASRVSGKRRYNRSVVEHLGMILLLRDVGFSLSEIKTLIASTSPEEWRDLAHHKVKELDGRIVRAQVARVALQHSLQCRHQNLFECPSFSSVVAGRLVGKPLDEAHAH